MMSLLASVITGIGMFFGGVFGMHSQPVVPPSQGAPNTMPANSVTTATPPAIPPAASVAHAPGSDTHATTTVKGGAGGGDAHSGRDHILYIKAQ